jgi:hypothetical protein
MKILKMYGYSDDLIEVRGDWRGEYQASDGTRFDLTANTGRMRIHAVYDGAWGFAITSNDEAADFRKMPAWAVQRTFGRDKPYSETLVIEAPDDAEFTQNLEPCHPQDYLPHGETDRAAQASERARDVSAINAPTSEKRSGAGLRYASFPRPCPCCGLVGTPRRRKRWPARIGTTGRARPL